MIRTDPGVAEPVLAHLRKYGVFDDVAIADQSAGTFEIHLAGPDANLLVQRAAASCRPKPTTRT